MSMFCYQCQETAGNTGCTIKGVCGKEPATAKLQDLLIWSSQGLAAVAQKAAELGIAIEPGIDQFAVSSLFMTITNANFDDSAIRPRIAETLRRRDAILSALGAKASGLPEAAAWKPSSDADWEAKSESVGVLSLPEGDRRSLVQLLVIGLKGLAAYLHHAEALGKETEELNLYVRRLLATLAAPPSDIQALIAMVLELGSFGVKGMALLDGANTGAYGNPEISKVNIGVRANPGILVSGHDLHDIEELLEQTAGTGVDVYTHSEMLPAHYYPGLKKFPHLAGNYGSSWWKQKEDFESFNGPVLMTTNCIVPPPASYKERLYTTGAAGFPGCTHIADRKPGGKKDFSALIAHAKRCPPPREIETGSIVGGFAHNQVMALADKVIAAVKSGAIRKFVVMGGCDGRHRTRSYYEDFAKALPPDTVILTAGCAKYRYIKLGLGDIGGIPRVLDAGQCNDSYSLARIALALKDAFGLDDINKLPIAYNIAWYEQKAVIVLLALLSLGVKNIHLGPTLPAFLSPGVVKVLVDGFGIAGITNVDEDLKALVG